MSSAAAHMPTPPPEGISQPPKNFDVVSHYNNLLHTDHEITKPIAAIESLIALLSASPPSTISETLALIESSTANLKSSLPNSIALSAGTDLFQRYIISSLQSGSLSNTGGNSKGDGNKGKEDDFSAIRGHLLANSKTFVQRAKDARWMIADVAKHFIRDGTIVLTCGRSRVVAAVLRAAAEDSVDFRVIYMRSAQNVFRDSGGTTDLAGDLRRRQIPVATIPFTALATAVPKASFIMVGADSVVGNGGVISSLGTHQMGILAKSVEKPFYVVAESHKFVRLYPLEPQELGIERDLLNFQMERDEAEGMEVENESYEASRKGGGDWVDLTPPELITALVTESGVHTPSVVSEELIKIWY